MGSCCGALCRELDIRNLGLKFHEPRAFSESPALPLPLFIFYRAFLGSFFVAAYVYVVLEYQSYLIILHFAYWSLAFVALYFIFGCLTSIWQLLCGSSLVQSSEGTSKTSGYHFLEHPLGDTSCALRPGERDDDKDLSRKLPRLNLLAWHHEVLWVLNSIAADTSVVVLVAYFSFWFHGLHFTIAGYIDLVQHIAPFLVMFIDSFVHGFPVRLLHVIYANIFGAVYVVFTIIYILTEVPDLKGNPTTFPSLEFGNTPIIYTAWLAVYIGVGFLVAQLFFYLMYKIRCALIKSGE
ncbi:protein rolling stone-like [Actinia tenebrosa]|uniref:Protein rolling stone-like n=1 Tax=Actinia tenebrosa TaxID=6105 RepID=A0A6P8H9P1_ACTTE|nr:protein rolling stone-like [Actinia tenebrosa]